jgi:hypothetical protein
MAAFALIESGPAFMVMLTAMMAPANMPMAAEMTGVLGDGSQF